ncbi:MAG: M48 family metallopeptidase, partial [Pseudomonadota bacterium]
MNFFEAQDSARRNTFWLELLFCAAVLGLIVLTNLLVLGLLTYSQTGTIQVDPEALAGLFRWSTFMLVALGVLVLVSGGSLYKIVSLRGGGRVVAEMLGGVLVPANSKEPGRRRLLNVVEEMAIASGTPVPAVYVLEESGINAFAAGWSPQNAVIGITEGALQTLSRDELQGVIAHEFSHILHGDMRLNIQLTGILHGILLLGMIGYFVLRSLRHARSSRSEKGGGAIVAVLALGLGLMVIGYVGTFCGQLIKAMVSRQREFLADASAVRYTRDRDGIAGALKKIGGTSAGSLLSSPAAPEFSHAYFVQGITLWLQSVFATHPPLEQRIQRIDPQWDGRYAVPKPTLPAEAEEAPATTGMVDKLLVGAAVAEAIHAVDQIGDPTQAHVGYARELLSRIPAALKLQTQDPHGARAVIYGLVMHSDPATRANQQAILEQNADPDVVTVAADITPAILGLDKRLYLPLIDLCLPALRELSGPQYQTFRMVIAKLMYADGRLDLREWIIRR